jgi:transcriptional regulator with XRE-family HTH domain
MAKAKEVKTLEEWRAHRGLTVQAMADAAGLTRGAMGDYIKGRKEPGIRLAYRIAGALGVDVTQIANWRPEVGSERGTSSEDLVAASK